jgi:hypothetical protein
VLLAATLLIGLAQWAKGHTPEYAMTHGIIWGIVSATIFTVARIWQSRRKQHCAICKDTPEMANPGAAMPDKSPQCRD